MITITSPITEADLELMRLLVSSSDSEKAGKQREESKKGMRWTEQEVVLLKENHQRYKTMEQIAQHQPGRDAKSCNNKLKSFKLYIRK